jgi:cell wall-associated NlpC family hydrolase
MPRRVNLVILLGLIIGAVFSFGLSAGAQQPDATGTTEEQIGVAQAELTELRTQAEVAAEEYNSVNEQVQVLNREIANTTRDLEEAEERLATAQEDFTGQTAQMYKSGNVAFVDVLFGAKDFNDFATRLELWAQLIGKQRDEVQELRAARDEIKAEENERARQVETQEQSLADMQARWEWANALQADTEAYLNSLNEDLLAELKAAQEAEAAEAAAAAAEAAEEAQRNLEQQEAQSNLEQATVEAAPVAQTTPTQDPAAEEALAAAAEQAKLAAEQREAQRQAEENAAKEAAVVEQARQVLTDAQNEAERKKAQEEAAAAEKRARDEANRAAEAELAKKNAEQALADEQKKAQAATPSDPVFLPKDKEQPKSASDPESDPVFLPKDKEQTKAASDPESDPVFLPKDKEQTKAASDPDSDPKGNGQPKGKGQPKAASGAGGAPIAEARSVLGAPYVLGGEDPSGFDCSGLVKWSYRGIRELPHSVDGIGSSGTQISPAEAGPGDVLVWPGYHVAMVTGPGMMIHASNYHMQVIEVSQGDMEPASYAVRL